MYKLETIKQSNYKKENSIEFISDVRILEFACKAYRELEKHYNNDVLSIFDVNVYDDNSNIIITKDGLKLLCDLIFRLDVEI